MDGWMADGRSLAWPAAGRHDGAGRGPPLLASLLACLPASCWLHGLIPLGVVLFLIVRCRRSRARPARARVRW
jgi:hypothetical protein